jgi:hypothetical protein
MPDSHCADGLALAHRGTLCEGAVHWLKAAPQAASVVDGDHWTVHHDAHEAHGAVGGRGDRDAVVRCP